MTCPYVCTIRTKISTKLPLKKKAIDDVLGDDTNAETVQAKCEKCYHDTAYFQMFQTRSADEPMTQFYKCVKCGHQWKI